MNCKAFQTHLPDLVLDPAAPSAAEARAHLTVCPSCEQEYTSLVATMSAMDAWVAPEPSAYFDQKLAVRLREEADQPKLGFFGRLREHLLFNTGRQFRPAAAGVLAFILLLGGGYVGFDASHRSNDPAHVSATINDLQILDRNDQALRQMDQLLQDDDSGDDSGANAPT